MIGPQLRQSKQASFTQRKVLVPTFKRREETQVLGLRGGTNHPQKLRPKVYLLPTPTKNTFFFGFHASEKSNFQQRRERRCQYARFFFFRIVNDPSAGSPTETLLRLLLPLNDQV